MEELESRGISHCAEIASFFQNKGYDQSFHTPSGPFTVQSATAASQPPDVAFWVVDADDAANWTHSAQILADLMASGEVCPREKLLIVVNKM